MMPGKYKEMIPTAPNCKYNTNLDDKVYKLCLLGCTDKEIADIIGIAESTLNNWKKQYPSFLESIKRGKEEADAEIADALYKRAKGYEHREDKIFLHEGEPVVVPTTKHYAPDTAAAFIWLKNRRSASWKDKQQIEHTGKDGGAIEVKSMDDKQLEAELLKLGAIAADKDE